MLKVQLVGIGNDGALHEAKVNGEGELTFAMHQHPPADETLASFPFIESFVDDAGSTDMTINGIIAPTIFCVEAVNDVDTFVRHIDIEIADGTINGWGDFGGIGALANGIDFYWESTKEGLVPIDTFVDNRSFFRKAYNEPTILKVTGGGADTILPKLNMQILFGGEWGIQLRKNTTDKLCFRIQDDLTLISILNANASGRRI